MSDYLLQFGVSNLCISALLAMAAYTVHRSERLPALAHLLFVLVLVKLVTPSIVTVPMVPVPMNGAEKSSVVDPERTGTGVLEELVASTLIPTPSTEEAQSASFAVVDWIIQHWTTGLLVVWFVGSLGVFVSSLLRICRFNQLLGTASKPAAPEL